MRLKKNVLLEQRVFFIILSFKYDAGFQIFFISCRPATRSVMCGREKLRYFLIVLA
jgi:hypothetical protein